MIDATTTDRFYVSGRFPGLKKEEVWARLLATGARGVMSKSVASAYLCSDPTDAKLVASGKPLYTMDDLPGSLDGWLAQLQGAVAHCRTERLAHVRRGVQVVDHLAFGPPADDALIARVEAHLGGPLPEDVTSLMRQFNGVSCLVATLKGRGPEISLPKTLLLAAALLDGNAPLWQERIERLLGVIAIPTWEEIFFAERHMLCDPDAYNPRDKLKIGSLKLSAGELFARVFDLDLFHHYVGAMLYLDVKDGQAKVIYTTDYGADFTFAQPVSLRCYMESLVAGLWGGMSFAEQRPIAPVSKTAWPTYIHNVHGAPYVYLQIT